MKKIQIIALVLMVGMGSVPLVSADHTVSATDTSKTFVTRGEAIHELVDTFDLRHKEATFIGDCILHLDECFFVFSSMTRYDQLSLTPLQLYPDVPPAYKYADDINLATMLSLVHGNIEMEKSPFYPRVYMTRIHALKVILGAGDLLQWREKFELVRDLGNEDVLRSQTTVFSDVNALGDDTWWYPRYVNFALDTGIVDPGKKFRPDEPITADEYQTMLQRALKKSETYLNGQDTQQTQQTQQTGQRTDSSQQAVN